MGPRCHGQSVDQGQFQTKLSQAPKETRTRRTTCLLPHKAVYCKLFSVFSLNYRIEPGNLSLL